MAAPAIPPIRLVLTSTGLAVEEPHRPALRRSCCRTSRSTSSTGGAIGTCTASCPGIPVAQQPDDMRHGTEGAPSSSEHSGAKATTHPTVFRGIGNGHRAELVDLAGAPRFGLRPVGGAARSVVGAMVVQRALHCAQRAAEPALDPVPGAGPVPLRRPRGPAGPFDGPPGQPISSAATPVA
jgi:hypothetical protein